MFSRLIVRLAIFVNWKTTHPTAVFAVSLCLHGVLFWVLTGHKLKLPPVSMKSRIISIEIRTPLSSSAPAGPIAPIVSKNQDVEPAPAKVASPSPPVAKPRRAKSPKVPEKKVAKKIEIPAEASESPGMPIATVPVDYSPVADPSALDQSNGGHGEGSETEGRTSGGGNGDQVVSPLERIEPKYPVKAAREGVEGYVKIRFNVSADGNVEDAAIIEANPPRVFERAALDAVRQWRYKPRIENDVQVASTGLEITIEFRLTH